MTSIQTLKWIVVVAIVGLSLLAGVVSCKRHDFDLTKVHAEGNAIVAAMKQYAADTGEPTRDLRVLYAKYLSTPPKVGKGIGEWSFGVGYQRGGSTVVLLFRLQDDSMSLIDEVYEEGKGWRTLDRSKS